MRFRLTIAWVLTLLIVAAGGVPTGAQFGKNKVTYHDFDWEVYESPHFDVHYYPSMEPFLEDIVSYVESAYVEISELLDHELRFRVPLIVYKTHGEFRQTNIILSEIPEGVAAFAEPTQYRMVLPIDLPPDELYELIAHELTHIFQYSIFYDGYLGRALRSRAPTWLIEGMASFVAQDEDSLDQMVIRDAVVNNILPPIEALNSVTFLTYRYGHAVFDFIEQEHGTEGLRNFIFEFKKVLLTGNSARAIKEAFGYDIDEFNRRFNRYLRKKYFPILLEKKSPDEYGTEVAGRRLRRNFVLSPTVSPSGELVAALAVPKMEIDLTVLSAEDGRVVKNVTKGWTNKYRNIVTEAFSGKRDVSWSPVADQVAVFVRKEQKWPLYVFNAITGRTNRVLEFDDLFEAASPAFSPDGRRIAFEANRDGTVDVFEVDLDTGDVRNLTQDEFFDANPWYAADGKTLLYNRRIGDFWKIFSVDLDDPSRKTQLTFGRHNDIQPAYSRNAQTIYFSSDRNEYGIFNIHSLDITTGDITLHTDVVGGAFAPQELAERDGETFLIFSAFFEGRFRLYRMALDEPEAVIPADERFADVASEAEEFKPSLQLRLDEEKKANYKLRWDIDTPTVGVGVADDGTFLANLGVTFTDLMGDQRISIAAQSIDSFQQYQVSYLNLKNRFNLGATAYDFRDFVFIADQAGGIDRRTEYRQTGATFLFQYPIKRSLRVDTNVGVIDTSSLFPADTTIGGAVQFDRFEDSFGTAEIALVSDTTRFQRFGPFQGHRIRLSTTYGAQISGDSSGDFNEHRMDLRLYQQATRRSLVAFRLNTRLNTADRALNTYGIGGVNVLRGYEFREFIGSNFAHMNVEFRFPLIDELRFPVFSLIDLRGFFFFDAAAAWFDDNVWYDPDLNFFRSDLITGEAIPFEAWDSKNDRLQDARASYGVGFQFIFLGGLQFNWAFSNRLDYTRYVFDPDAGNVVPIEQDGGGTRTDFYIVFDF